MSASAGKMQSPEVLACIVMAHIVMAHIVMAYIVMACKVMACIVIACIVMVCIVMACIVMAYAVGLSIVGLVGLRRRDALVAKGARGPRFNDVAIRGRVPVEDRRDLASFRRQRAIVG